MTRLRRLWHNPWLQTAVCLLLIALLTYLFLWRLWAAAPQDRAYLPERSDLGMVFYPPRHFFAKTLAETGEFALWNPHIYAGYPQFADPQAATFYPIALLTAVFTGADYSLDTIALDIGLHFFLAGAFAFLFFRHLFRRNLPALLSALLFEFGGYLTFYPVGQLSELEVAPWFPLTLLLVTLAIQKTPAAQVNRGARKERKEERKTGKLRALSRSIFRKQGWLLMATAGIALGQVFLAGRPQSYLTIGTVTVAWLIYTAWQAGWSWPRIGGRLLLLAGFALGIAAAQWLPTLELTGLSTRSILTYGEVAEGGFPFEQLTGFLVPQLIGTQNLYVGVMALLLAGLAVWRRQGIFWTAVFLVAIFVSVGKHLIIFDSLYLIQRLGFPGYMRNVERLAFAMTFSLAALSGYGLMLLLQLGRERLRRYSIAAAIIFGITLLLAGIARLSEQPAQAADATLLSNTITYVALMLGGGGLALWLWQDTPRLAIVAIAVIAVVDVASLNQGRFFVDAAASFAPGNDVERVMDAPPGERPFYRTVFDQTEEQDFGSLAGVDNIGGMPPLMLIDYERLRYLLDEYRRNVILNVDMVVTTGEYTDPAFELVAEADQFRYYRFTHALPRAYLVPAVEEVAGGAAAAERLAAPDFPYGTTALVVGVTGLEDGPNLAAGEAAVLVSRTPNTLHIEATTEQPRFLVVADTFYPGWRAEIDGESTEIYKTNVALRGIVVPSGQHTIRFTFRPATFVVGVGLSLTTALLWFLWLLGSGIATYQTPDRKE